MKHKLLLVFLLLCAVWAFAQTYPSQNPNPSQTGQSSTQTSTQSSSQGSSSSDKETTVQGCLSGSSGNYTITDSSGKTWQLAGDTSKLSEHVGHTVEVKGTPSSSGSSTSGAGSAGSSSSASTKQTLNMTSMKHISPTCTSSR